MRDHVYAIVSGNSRYPAAETRWVGGQGGAEVGGGGEGIVDRSPGIPIIAI